MIISRTPLRISFAGGGSDLRGYYKENSGAVVSTAINKYIYIVINKRFDESIRLSYSKTEIVSKVKDLEHEYVRECLKYVGIKGGIEITSISDIPLEGTGLGSSCSFVVGLLNALYAYQGKFVSSQELARQACEIEIDILKKPIGKQDQYISAYGGLQYIRFYNDESVHIDPIICKDNTKDKIQSRLLLFYTGLTRSTEKILTIQNENFKKNLKYKNNMYQMVTLAHKMAAQIQKNSLSNFGSLLDENWKLKRTMADGITSPKIDKCYEIAMKKGAEGAKILGAGGGGFLLVYAMPKYHKSIIRSLGDLRYIDFKFEGEGSKIIFIN